VCKDGLPGPVVSRRVMLRGSERDRTPAPDVRLQPQYNTSQEDGPEDYERASPDGKGGYRG
jgi:hypothetical protein